MAYIHIKITRTALRPFSIGLGATARKHSKTLIKR